MTTTPAGSRAGLQLLVTEPGDDTPGVFHLRGQALVVGRDEGADVLIEEASVSGRHGLLEASAAGATYRDLGSRNGSVLVRAGGAPTPLAPGEPVFVAPGDALLLGDAARPVRFDFVALDASPGPAHPVDPTRTVVATAPLAALLGRRDEGLVTLAAEALTAPDAAALAEAARAFLAALLPAASGRGAAIWGAGLHATAGDEIPAAVRAAALERLEVVLFAEGDAALAVTASVVATGARAFVVAPLVAHGASVGLLAAWSPLGIAALPSSALPQLAVAASLAALSAAQLAVRAEGEAERRRLRDENSRLRGAPTGLRVVEPIGGAPVFTEALTLARSVAGSDVPVLLYGETGSGKEVVARNIHLWSRRAPRAFVAFNCAAVPEALIESELFGHVRGAFTGAGSDRKGLFEEADGGTILLDEIGEMPAVMQAKLLRVLQDGEVRRVGANRSQRVDVRVVSATHRDLAQLVTEGRFRADLMYRLNAVTLRIPALRERGEDVALLAHFLLGRAADSARKRIPGFAADALWALSRYEFPGNVRELENEILRAVALTPEGEPIRAAAFSERVAGQAPAPGAAPAGDGAALTLKDAVSATERAVVEAALARQGGNVSQAARELGLTRPGLYKVMERLGMR